METKWLEDFICLAETKSFRRAADARHVSQPAFSRRIQALEAWLGAELVDRSASPAQLTPVGRLFYEQALDMLAQINEVRSAIAGHAQAQHGTIDFAASHALSQVYAPGWLDEVQREFGNFRSRLISLSMQDAVASMIEASCDLLLCYAHPQMEIQLDPGRYEMLVLGSELLRPYARCGSDGRPEHALAEAVAGRPVPFLAYSGKSFLGGVVELLLRSAGVPLNLDKQYETDTAEGLKMMALQGRGIAFLPASSVTREIALKQLAPAAGAGRRLEANLEIRLYRARPTAQRPGKPVVSRLWSHLAHRNETPRVPARTTVRGRSAAGGIKATLI